MQNIKNRRRNYIKYAIAVILFIYVLFYLPTPYVVYKPGLAKEIRPMVSLEQPASEENGVFMLTTVTMSYPYANVFNTLQSFIDPHKNLARRADVFGDESVKEYSQRQSFVMKTSQSNAIQAVYHLLNIPYEMETLSITVSGTMPNTDAAKQLAPGDEIIAIDGAKVSEAAQLQTYVAQKNVGDSVKLTVKRDGMEKELQLSLSDISEQSEEPRAGIGVFMAIAQTPVALDAAKQVRLTVKDIGGPSAGLMFALQIYNMLTAEDLTNGYRIAGTGTISTDGKVGVIGSIDYKVVASERQNADIFFAPRDLYPKEGQQFEPILNYSLAKLKAEQIDSKMQIVPVSTLQEAIDYLQKLPPKQAD